LAAPIAEQFERRVAERRPQAPDILAAASGEDAEHAALRLDAESSPRGRAAGPGAAVDQRVAHVVAPESEPAEESLLERQHHGQPVHRRREPPSASRPPGPKLGRNVVEDLGPRPLGRFGHADAKTGLVDEADELVPARAEPA